MKKLIAFMLLLSFSGASMPAFAEEKRTYFLLNVAPVNPERKVDWGAGECLLRISDDKEVVLSMAGGKKARGWLRRGQPVVVDRSGIACWVYNCGNAIVEPERWRSDGVKECNPARGDGASQSSAASENNRSPTDFTERRDYPSQDRPPYLPPENRLAESPREKAKRENRTAFVIAGVILAIGVAGAVATFSPPRGHGGSPGGGPAPDPKN